jgi:hypothetical protein
MPKSANALFVEGSNLTKIQLTIENETVELSHGDFMEFKRKGLSEIKTQRAKILSFGWHNGSSYANRIFFLPWRDEESRWGSHVIPMRLSQSDTPLEHSYFHDGDLADQPNGDWTTIRKLDESPEHQ